MSLKSVLVTGSNRGIGLEMIGQLLSGHPSLGHPRHVFACYRDPKKIGPLKEMADGSKGGATKLHLVQLEVTEDKQIAEAVKFVDGVVGEDGLNLLINNAAILERDGSQFPSLDRGVFLKHLDANVVSPALISQAFLPLLSRAARKQMGDPVSIFRSSIVNISSGAGSIGSTRIDNLKLGVGYRVSKAALNMVTKCSAVDLKDENILFVSISPGWVKTDMGTEKAISTTEESVREMFNTLPTFNQDHNGGFFRRDGTAIPF